MDFTDKVFLITGASSGIGAGAAEYLANLNAKLALVGRNEQKLMGVVEKCCKLNSNNKPLPIIADITVKPEQIIKTVIDHFGQLDVLVNNAGIVEMGTIETATMDQYDRVMRTNVRAIFELSKLAVPHLIATKGNIVNVSSITGMRSFEKFIIYCMSKAALDQFTRCMSLDLASKNVRVNSVNPGIIKTDFHLNYGFDQDTYIKYLQRGVDCTPIGRYGLPNDIAPTIAFLASDTYSSFMTGAIIPVDGGRANSCPR